MKDEITFYTHFNQRHTNPALVVALVIFSILLIILVSMNGVVYVRRRKAKRNFLHLEKKREIEPPLKQLPVEKDIETEAPQNYNENMESLVFGEENQEESSHKLTRHKQQPPPILSNPMAEINQAHLYPDSMADLYNTVP